MWLKHLLQTPHDETHVFVEVEGKLRQEDDVSNEDWDIVDDAHADVDRLQPTGHCYWIPIRVEKYSRGILCRIGQ